MQFLHKGLSLKDGKRGISLSSIETAAAVSAIAIILVAFFMHIKKRTINPRIEAAYESPERRDVTVFNDIGVTFPGGNLEKFIRDRANRVFKFEVLHKIALDIALGIAYLHDQCFPRIVHRDVQPSNILLDNELNAYLSDFGLSRIMGTETCSTTNVAGTFGYVALEYALTCRVSDKTDVYSYDIVLLEFLSDKCALDPLFSMHENGFNIISWVSMLLRVDKIQDIFYTNLWEAGPQEKLVDMLHLALMCTTESLSAWPRMRQVVGQLKKIAALVP